MSTTPPRPNWRAFARLFAHRPRLTALVGALTLLGMLSDGIGLMLLVPLLGSLTGEAATSGFAQHLMGLFSHFGFQPSLGAVLMLFLGAMSLRAALRVARDMASVRLRTGLVDDLRNSAMAALLQAEWRWLSLRKDSTHANLLLTEVQRAGMGVNAALMLAAQLAGVLAFLGVAIGLDTLRGGAILLLAFGLFALFSRLRRRAFQLGHSQMLVNRELHETAQETLGALKLAKILGSQAAQLRSFSTAARDLRHNQQHFALVSGSARELFQWAGAVLVAGYVYFGVSLWRIPLAELLVMVFILARLVPMLSACQQQLHQLANALPALHAAQSLIAEARHWAEPAPLPGHHAPTPQRCISVKNLSLCHQSGSPPALNDVTLDLPVGSITVVSGPSGAGKTTLADVLMGLVAPDQGALFIDDMPLDAAGRLAWRQAVSYVPQEVVIYAGTLRGNLARACPDATDAQMHAALGAAAADFTANWPAGLDTLIGPGGRQLSGGERQRLALARGLLRQPSLLILDEVSSALDPENEGRIRDSVAQLAGRITTVILGHSAAFDSIATQHYMLNAGRGQRAPAPRRTEPAA